MVWHESIGFVFSSFCEIIDNFENKFNFRKAWKFSTVGWNKYFLTLTTSTETNDLTLLLT